MFYNSADSNEALTKTAVNEKPDLTATEKRESVVSASL